MTSLTNFSNDIVFMLQHFFTHKDFLPQNIPGTIFTPIQIVLEVILIIFILSAVKYVAKRRHLILPVLKTIFFTLVIFEFLIVFWDSTAGATKGLNLAVNLPLYPCSIFMFSLPFVIWGNQKQRQIASAYICTLGLLGSLINFLYPISRLLDYSCISFPAFHTFLYHGAMLFTCLLLLKTKIHCYGNIASWWNPFLAAIPGLLMSIPANIINYSAVHSDYMYFTNQHFLSIMILGNASAIEATIIMYIIYIFVPASFYLPAFLMRYMREHDLKIHRLIQSLINIH